MRKYLFNKGFRYRVNVKDILGSPDIVLKKYNTIIFVNGCFWHGHKDIECKEYKIPQKNTEWWLNKIKRNIDRDEKNIKALIENRWNVIIIWECQLKKSKREKTLSGIVDKLYQAVLEKYKI